jgi:hypothetical protein
MHPLCPHGHTGETTLVPVVSRPALPRRVRSPQHGVLSSRCAVVHERRVRRGTRRAAVVGQTRTQRRRGVVSGQRGARRTAVAREPIAAVRKITGQRKCAEGEIRKRLRCRACSGAATLLLFWRVADRSRGASDGAWARCLSSWLCWSGAVFCRDGGDWLDAVGAAPTGGTGRASRVGRARRRGGSWFLVWLGAHAIGDAKANGDAEQGEAGCGAKGRRVAPSRGVW